MHRRRISYEMRPGIVPPRHSVSNVGYVAANRQVIRLPRTQLHYAVQLPIAEDLTPDTMAEIALPPAKWQIPNSTHRKKVRDVIRRNASATFRVVIVLKTRRAARSIFDIEPAAAAHINRL